ncbi:cytochrome-c peroxidase [Paracraurococcus lichenis]|uniref:Cytochrome c peroxidase n=1 Tax=Paracraurococcus lichenis TaxID=3064888 RepID=A0ABT9EC36_9PROT|nr:cytochrome c peroxidase [Paracraurococcus sp. LOR1-02]MDO9713749.1 cytochrome c peroxidase [Paracraurococcus sp. LOR1-02]
MAMRNLRAAVLACCIVLLPGSLLAEGSPPGSTVELREMATALLGAVSATPESVVGTPLASLGRALFWDTRLSANGEIACASCHYREGWSSDTRAKSTDARGRQTGRQSQPVFHAMETSGLRWLADRPTGAAQAEGSITGSMGFARSADILPALRQHGYEPLFRTAFLDQPDPVTPANYGLALQAYQATLRTPAPFDRWLTSEEGAMDERQVRGLRRFIEVGCAGCHNGPLLGGRMLQRFGIVEEYWRQTGSTGIDAGLASVTRKEEDRFVFRVPMLRNVARTAPYFHDGTVADLRQATRIMARVQVGQELDEAALDELVAFLEALTGEIPAHFAPPPGVPFALPPGIEHEQRRGK